MPDIIAQGVENLKRGDSVVLLSLPDGCTSRHLPLTVGKTYVFKYFDGSNICTTTDESGLDGHYWRGRVRPADAGDERPENTSGTQ